MSENERNVALTGGAYEKNPVWFFGGLGSFWIRPVANGGRQGEGQNRSFDQNRFHRLHVQLRHVLSPDLEGKNEGRALLGSAGSGKKRRSDQPPFFRRAHQCRNPAEISISGGHVVAFSRGVFGPSFWPGK